MKKLLMFFIALMVTALSYGQVSTTVEMSGTPIAGSPFSSLAEAITALNGLTITGPVVVTASAGSETNPAGGYSITATGTAANTITIQGAGIGNTVITAPSPAGTSGALNDAIFKIIGGDYITIQGFSMNENAANTTTTATSNNMVEFGVALFYATATNGCQNITIKDNAITLNRTYQNTFGIYVNSTHTATAVTTSATATGTAGGNHNLVITGNSISNVNMGIVVVGPTAAADMNNVCTIGGSVANANTITNFGTTGTISSYANVSGTVNGILVRNTNNFTISYNTIESSNGGTTSGTLNGIQIPAFSATPTGTFTNNINYNNISLRSAAATGAINGINYPSGSATTTSSLNINNNNFYTFGHTVAASGTITFILNASTHLNQSISNNTFTNITVNTTGSVTFISNSNTLPAGGVKNINNNSIVTGFNKTGAGGTVTVHTDGSSSPAGTTVNNNNNNFSNITVTGATTITGWYNQDGGAPTKTIQNNTFNNWTGGTSAITVMTIGYSAANSIINGNTITNITGQSSITGLSLGSSSNFNVYSNTINSLTSSGTGGAVIGISVGGINNNVYLNQIHTLSSTASSSAVTGISVSAATLHNIYRNKIYNLSSSSTGSTNAIVNGITISAGTTVNFYNNLIGDLRATTSAATDAIRGINITSTTSSTSYNIYFNTVYLNASSSGANFGTSCIFHTASTTSTTARLTMNNNIFVNYSTQNGTGLNVVYRRSSGAANMLQNYASTSNNNLFYIKNTGSNDYIYHDGTSSAQNIAAYKSGVFTAGTISPRDQVSISEDAPFLSTTGSDNSFLHIDPSVQTQIESGGIPISGITDDFDGNTRNASTPDIGADEGDFTPLDLTPPSISYTALSNTSSTTDRTLTATITDASGVDAAYLYWRANTDPYQAVQGVNTSGNTWEFTFGGNVNPGDVISYYIVAQDINKNVGAVPNAGVTSYTSDPPACSPDPTNPSTYTIVNAVCGQYSIGAGKTFESITAALAYITANEVTCPIELLLSDTYNSSSETYPITINQITGINATNTLTIKPDAGVTASITGNSTSIFKLNGADYITIDGSNSNGTDRSLTITNNSTSGVVIWNASMGGVGNGAKFNTFKNLNIVGGSGTSSSTYGIVSAATSSVSTAAEDNDNLTILNCNISKVYYGISAINSSTSNLTADNLVISNNTIGSNTASDYVIFRGIQVAYANAPVITKNVIFNLITSSSLNVAAIDIGAGVIDGSVTKNIISGIYSTSTSGYGAYGINFSSATGTTNVLVANNFISDLKTANYSSTSTTYNAFGIRITGGTNLKIYHNSINMFGTVTSHTLAGMSANMVITAALTGLDVRNNIFVNTQTFGVAGSFAYNIYLGSTGITFANINNNDYWGTSGTNTTYIVGYDGSTARTTLNDWKTYTTQDANSVAIAPVFTSPVNLLLTPADNATLNDLGTNLYSFVPDDIEDHQRSTTPDMGADEFTPPLCSGAVAGTAVVTGNSTFCGSGVPNITASGYSTGLGSGYQWQYSNDNFQTDINDFVGQTNPATLNTGSVTSTTYYRLKVTCTSGQAVDYSNIITITIKPVPSASASGNGPLCAGGTINLSGSTDFGTSFAWTGPNGFTSTDQNPSILSATTLNSGTYSLITVFDGCNSAASTVNVTVNANPSTVTVTPASADLCSGTVQLLTASGGTIGGTGTIGTGSSSNTTTTPYKGYWGGNKSQFLFTASELTAIGLTPGTPINAIRFSINTFTSPYTFNNFTIGMKNTTSTVLTTTIETGVTTVLAPTTLILSGTAPFTVTHNLTTPFVWDGSNLLIETCFTNNDGGGATGNSASVLSTTTATNMSNYFSADNSSTVCSSPGTASVSTLRPNIWFSFSTPTYITWSPLTDLFTDPLAQTPYTGTATNTVYASPSTNAVYTATATSTANCTNSGTSSLTIVSSPSITSHPASSVKCSGQTATFSVTASIPNVTYQWRKDGQNIDVLQNASAATSTLQINNVSTSDAGNYDVIVSAACGTPQISDIATLTIIQTPTASASSNLPVCSGSTLNLYGTTDIGTTFAWTGPNGFTSTDQNPVLNNVSSANSGTYSFVATSNGCSSAAGTVNLLVNPSPSQVSVTPINANICDGDVQLLTATGGQISQTLINENFNGTPTGWTTINASTGGTPANAAWMLYNSSGTFKSNDSTVYVMSNSDAQGSGGTTATQLISPTFSTVGLSNVTLTFWHYYREYTGSTARVEISTDGGTNWESTALATYTTTQGTATVWVQVNIPLNSYLNQPNLKIRFRYNATWGYYWAIDNVVVSGTGSSTITWSPITDLYTDASATNQYDGISHAATVYAKPSTGNYNYTATATSNAGCTSVSNTVTVVVNPILNVSVSISTPQTTVNDGTVVTFTANPTNGGTLPSYQWFVNGNPVGTNSNVFSYVPANNDAVTCQLTSDITSCITGNPATSNTITMTVISQGAVTRTWTGTVNNLWTNSLNWANGIPSNIDNVIIPANAPNYPTISAPVTINNLTIESNSTGTGSLLDNGNLTVTGNSNIKRYISGNKWHLLTSPITNALSGVFHLQAGQANIYIREYDPNTNSWSFITSLTAPLAVGKGYGIWADTQTNSTPDPVVSFNGPFNTGNITVPMVPNGWNIIGNPYPSAINWTLVDKTGLLNFGGAYFWRQSLNSGNGGYAFHDGSVGQNGATNIIPPMQGFFVKANTASLSFDNSMRVHTNQQLYNKSTATINDMIRITASNGADYTDETVILFNSNATNGFDNQFDALKLFSNNANAPEVYTVADNNKLVINRFGAYPAAIPMNIRLGVNANVTLKASEFDNFDANISIKLEDMLTGTIQDLRQNPSYTFAANIGENDNRFVLHFAQITGINEINATNVSIYAFDNTVYVNTNEKVKDISIYNMLGQLITSVEGNGKSIQTINLKNATAYYLVKVTTDKGVRTEKVFIK